MNLQESEEENPDILKSIHAMKGLFLKNSMEGVKSVTTPYHVTHSFKEGFKKASFMFFKYAGLKSKTEIEVTHPQGAKKRFYKTSNSITRL